MIVNFKITASSISIKIVVLLILNYMTFIKNAINLFKIILKYYKNI